MGRSSESGANWANVLNQLLAAGPDADAAPQATPLPSAIVQPSALATAPSASASAAAPPSARPSNLPSASASARAASEAPWRELDQTMLFAAAQTLHLGVPALRGELRGGISLREVATAQQVPFNAVQTAIETAIKPLLSSAVQQGSVTSAQSTAMLKAVLAPQFGTRPGVPRP